MRVYKKLTIISLGITVTSFLLGVLLQYGCSVDGIDFWVNVCLGIFGSGALTTLTSLVTYHHEKRKNLEGFAYHTRQILSYLNKYQDNMALEQKLNFFLGYKDFDKSAWDIDFGDMDFFFERKHHNRKYIFEKIYKPILDFNTAVSKHVWHFRWHLDGSGKNEDVMHCFIAELQEYLLEKTEQKVPIEYDENGIPISYCQCSSVSSRLVRQIQKELNGHYYEVMYGKRNAKKDMELEEEETNEQTEDAHPKQG